MAIIEQRLKPIIIAAAGVAGKMALKFFVDSFNRQAWLDNSSMPWKQRKGNKDSNRAVLVGKGSGRLRRSLRITSITPTTVTIGSDVPYAKVHNEGFKGTVSVREHTRNRFSSQKVGSGKILKSGKEGMRTMKSISGSSNVRAHTMRMNMPRRQFMGDSAIMSKQIERQITADIMKAFRI